MIQVDLQQPALPRKHMSSPQNSRQFARLALCSHVFYEREIIEQQKEIESLKLKLFWKDYDVSELVKCMKFASRRRLVSQSSSYYDILDMDYFMWTGPVIQSYGLEVQVVDWQPGDPMTMPPRVDLDTHFVCRRKYHITSYGSKLWKARSIDDPELKKLKALFDAFLGGEGEGLTQEAERSF